MIDNFKLRQSVLNELSWDTHFDASHVTVITDGGTVTLGGCVGSYSEIFSIREAVRQMHGVIAIADEIKVNLPNESVRDDTDIAVSVGHIIDNNVIARRNTIKAVVREGIVTLSGEVEWQNERKQIELQIAHIQGVKQIINNIALKKTTTPENVKEQIKDALERNARLEASKLNVSVDKNEVTLTGTVKAFYERNLVEAAAWNAPGVNKVVDKIKVCNT